MNKFTNPSIMKEKKRITRNLIFSFLVLIIAVAFSVWGYYEVQKAEESTQPLNDIIVNEKGGKEDMIATVDVYKKPYLFAEQQDNPNGYYIVMDSNNFMYIVYMSKYDELTTKQDIATNPVTIKGGTKLISKEVKDLALEAYNEGLKEEEKLTMADFSSYFGNVYLDITSTGTDEIAFFQYIMAFILGLLGIIAIVVNIIQKAKFSKGIKKMDESLIETLDNEMNAQDAFYYERIHLYLTNHYIINFKGTFRVIEYQDIIWMYSMIYRYNGIKTNQSIKVMTKDGKTHEIAAIDVATKAKKEMYEEIWNTIISKNSRMAIGYTKEAEEEAKQNIER